MNTYAPPAHEVFNKEQRCVMRGVVPKLGNTIYALVQETNFIPDHLGDVHHEMPNMAAQGHHTKNLAVAQGQQAAGCSGWRKAEISPKRWRMDANAKLVDPWQKEAGRRKYQDPFRNTRQKLTTKHSFDWSFAF